MTEPLYLTDSYAKECEATVASVKDSKYVVLDKTIFYPKGGGQPSDTGKIVRVADGSEFKVIFAGKFECEVSHEIDREGLQSGDKIKCLVNWERRHKLMRMHTA